MEKAKKKYAAAAHVVKLHIFCWKELRGQRKAYHSGDMPFFVYAVKHKKARLSTSLNGEAEGT